MKQSAKDSMPRLWKLIGLVGVAILVSQLAPTREEYRHDSRMDKSSSSRDGQTAGFPSSGRNGREWLFSAEKPFLTEEGRFDSWYMRPGPLDQRLTVKSSTSSRTGDSNEDSIANLERTVLIARAPGARIDAVEALTQTNELDKAKEVLFQVVLIDRNADVRLAALEALDEIDAIPFETLAPIASNDTDFTVRLRAVELIGELRERGAREIEFLKRLAKTDSSNDVRQLASHLLAEVMRGK